MTRVRSSFSWGARGGRLGLSALAAATRVYHDGQSFNVYCIAVAADAEKFMTRFGSETFDPAQKGKGQNWTRWKK